MKTIFVGSARFLAREWKAVTMIALALYVAVPLVEFLEKDSHSLDVSVSTNIYHPLRFDGVVRVGR
ncbi:MAG: hypothetical protein J0J01_19815 [Reyranella sp.]|uniref:hypothetical protein n=1 Tax=Reyranella sp. TaxID=1929291 RepID=UPI001ACD90B3|nr:hypothetical protein [Reyranella sp.]MBN9089159.1 hypothetical protein [Reyranella sp.]